MNQPLIFIINLKKDVKKKKHVTSLCDKYNLKYKTINAIDGSQLDEKVINDMVDYKLSLKTNLLNRKLTKSEVGCLLSHRLIYKKIINENIEVAIVLEDDCEFDDSLVQFLKHINDLPTNLDLLLLGQYEIFGIGISVQPNFWSKRIKLGQFTVSRPTSICMGTHGYLITYRGAQKLISQLNKFHLPIDHYTGCDKYSNLYFLTTPIVFQDKILSSQQYSSMAERNSQEVYTWKNYIFKKLGIFEEVISIIQPVIVFFKRFKLLRKY